MATFSSADLAAISGAECSIAPLDTPMPSMAAHTTRIPAPSPIFLVLAPITSTDYPTTVTRTPSVVPASATPVVQAAKDRRSSSVSSSGGLQKKFLKLGPVHNGGDHGVSDFAEDVEA